MIDREDLLEMFLKEKGLIAEFNEWKKEAEKPYLNVRLSFNLEKYKFKFQLSPEQLAIFVDWAKTLEDDYPFKALLDRVFKNGDLISQTWSDVFLLGKDVKEIFDKIEHDPQHNLKSINLGSGKTVDIEWEDWGRGITEDDYTCDYADDEESGKCAASIIEECQDWDYTTNGHEGYSSTWNIEDK